MTPAWLLLAFDAAFPDLVGADRDRRADLVCEHIPKDAIVAAITLSTSAVLATHGIRDGAGDLAREIARNSAQTVLFALTLDEEHEPAEQPSPVAARGRK